MLFPLFGSLALATGTIVERLVLMKKSISVKFYQSAQFLSIILVMLPFIPFFWNISNEALTQKNILIFVGVIALSILANYFTFFAMKKEKLGKLESAKITEPLFIVLLAFILSFIFGEAMYDRNPRVLIPALIAGIALVFSQIEKHHLRFNKYYLSAILGSFLFASELILSKLILEFYNPITFYFLRCAGVFLVSAIVMKPQINGNIKTKTILQILATGAIWFVYRIVIYFGYANLGVVETTLSIMLGPILVYIFAAKILKEKLSKKQIITGFIVIACIAYANFM